MVQARQSRQLHSDYARIQKSICSVNFERWRGYRERESMRPNPELTQ
jgi:hypothetical protein